MRMTLVNVLMFLLALSIRAEKSAAQMQTAGQPLQFNTATAYYDGDWIPNQYTCGVSDGSSPGLQWSNAPQGTVSFALIFHDADAFPGNGKVDVTHWILWNIPASAMQLPAGVQPGASPDGIQQGKNIRGVNGYQPPCPPVGSNLKPHHYVFDLYALDNKLALTAGASREDLQKAIDGHVIGKASITGIFGQGVDDKSWRWGTAKLP